jgi:chromosome segregation ATPase
MIKLLIRVVLVLVIGVLVYNYFFGTAEEKENVQNITGKVKDLGGAVKDLLVDEKEKFDSGKYDDALDKMGTLLENLKEKGAAYRDQIADLDQKRKAVQDHVDQVKNMTEGNEEEIDMVKKELQDLMKETEKLIQEME